MRAFVIEEYGGADAFTAAELPVPEPGPREVRVEVRATSLNPVDVKIRRGDLPAFAPDLPARLHCDVSGVVDAVGSDVTAFDVGDEVYGMPGGAGEQGALAEYATAHEDTVAPAPESIPLEAAAAVPVVGLTALELLEEKADVDGDDDVLVYGGAGGVGHAGVQLASAAGASVVATGSTAEKRGLAERLGADATVDYTDADVEEYVAEHAPGGFDVVFDPVGDDHLATSFEAVRPYGDVVTTESSAATDLDLGPMHQQSLSLGVVLVILPVLRGEGRERIGRELRTLAERIDAGEFEPHLDDRRFEFEAVADAHRYWERDEHVGKILLTR